MSRLPVEWNGGHMIVDPFPGSGTRALIDTGAGHTASHRKGDGYLGKTLADIEKMAGTRLDLLVGLDAFRDPVLLTREFVEFGAARPDVGSALRTPRGRGLIHFEVELEDGKGITRKVQAMFDSGADKSYIDPDFAGEFLGITEDFFPPVGGYRAFQFRNHIRIGGHSIAIEPIVAADRQIGVTSQQRPLLIGSELIRNWGDLWVDLPMNEVVFIHRPIAIKDALDHPDPFGLELIRETTEYQDTVRYLHDRT